MGDNNKTKKQLITELEDLRRQIEAAKEMKNGYAVDERAYQNFFNISDDMLCIAGLDGYFKLVNPAFEKVLGYTKEELLSKPFYDLVHSDEQDANLNEVQSLSRGAPLVYCEHRYLCKDGSYKWLAWTSYTDTEEGMIYAVAKDITRLKHAEEALQRINDELENQEAFSSMITGSKKMLAIFHYIEAVAGSRKPVLITGETGTGKELLARSVHLVSGLQGLHIAVNVAGLDDTVFSDTLFGHRKGAYTGADKDRKGLVVKAAGGTLLLDEIGDLSESSQVKLLRLLEEQIYYPLGSDAPEKSNARIIACSNRDIEDLVSKGKMRKDLYYRLKVHHIHIPPLRERIRDIPLLFEHIIEEAALSMKKKKPAIPDELITLLCSYHYPGNIRELKAMVYDTVARNKSGRLSLDIFKELMKLKDQKFRSSLPSQVSSSIADVFGRFPTLKDTENHLISEALKRSKGNQGIAASLLGISRQALNQRLKKKNRP